MANGALDTDADPALDPIPVAAQEAGQGLTGLPGQQVPHSLLQSRLGYVVTPHRSEAPGQLGRVLDLLAQHQGHQEIALHVPAGAHRFVGVPRPGSGRRFPVARQPLPLNLDNDRLVLCFPPEAGLEGVNQGQPNLS